MCVCAGSWPISSLGAVKGHGDCCSPLRWLDETEVLLVLVQDNVKYLGTLERFFEPLYNGTPSQVAECIPALINAIKMIYTVSRCGCDCTVFLPLNYALWAQCLQKILSFAPRDGVCSSLNGLLAFVWIPIGRLCSGTGTRRSVWRS